MPRACDADQELALRSELYALTALAHWAIPDSTIPPLLVVRYVTAPLSSSENVSGSDSTSSPLIVTVIGVASRDVKNWVSDVGASFTGATDTVTVDAALVRAPSVTV